MSFIGYAPHPPRSLTQECAKAGKPIRLVTLGLHSQYTHADGR